MRANLVRLLQSVDPSIDVRPQEDRPVEFDYHIPLMSLPMVLGGTEGRFLTQTPYLAAEPEKLKYWQIALGNTDSKWGFAGMPDRLTLRVLFLCINSANWIDGPAFASSVCKRAREVSSRNR